MKKDLENIKILINTFIDEELIIDYTQFIYTHVFFEQLEIYFNKNSVKKQISIYLGLKLGIENYKSSFKNNSRVYTKLKFTSFSILNISTHISLKDYNDIKNEMNILKINFNQSASNYLSLLIAHKELLLKFETLEIKYLETSKSLKVIEKDEKYTISNFFYDFIKYDANLNYGLTSGVIINDYINNSKNINFYILTETELIEQLKIFIKKFFNCDMILDKNVIYYKGIVYKNTNFIVYKFFNKALKN